MPFLATTFNVRQMLPPVSAKVSELDAMRAKIAQLEEEIRAERQDELAQLPASFGFDSVASFAAAVRIACGRRPMVISVSRGSNGSSRRRRVTITNAMREQVRKLLRSGHTGATIASAVGISRPSVQNIKRSLGLVRRRAS